MSIQAPPEVIYPDSDGKPLSDNTLQCRWIFTIKGGLDNLFRDDPNVFIAADLLWYPVEGDNKTRQAPDAMVAFGRPKGERGSYMQWREAGMAPQVAFEILSPKNRRREMDRKRAWYFYFGLEEYYEYDPDRVTLRGWVRQEGQVREVEPMEGWLSPRLGVRFELGDELILLGPDGQPFLTYEQMARQRDDQKEQARRHRLEAARQRRLAAQENQRADAEQVRADTEQVRAEAERQRAEAERLRADAERLRAERLAKQLRDLGIDPGD